MEKLLITNPVCPGQMGPNYNVPASLNMSQETKSDLEIKDYSVLISNNLLALDIIKVLIHTDVGLWVTWLNHNRIR